MSILVDFGGSLEDPGLGGCPPVIAAAANGHINVVSELILLGADVDAVDLDSNTALHIATKLPEPLPMIHLLIKYGANQSMRNRQSWTPLQMALLTVKSDAITALGR